MKPVTIFFLICIAALFCGCASQTSGGGLPVIDLTKQYPKKDIILQDIADIEYISLNGKNHPLMGNLNIGYISNDCYILYDRQNFDVFILEKDGSVRHHFNRRGNGSNEYRRIAQLTYDPKSREVYILDPSNPDGILVYTEAGAFIRSLQQTISEIYDFDDQTLIGYYGYSGAASPDDPNQRTPYVFISKQDGAIESRISINFTKRLPTRIMINLDNGVMPIMIATTESRKFKDKFLIADLSADTLYILSNDRILTPVLARTPSVQAQDPFVAWSVDLMTDRFIVICALEYDFETLRQQFLKNQQIGGLKSETYLYYNQSHEIVFPNFINADRPSVKPRVGMSRVTVAEKNMSASILDTFSLTEDLAKGELFGRLKEVALTLAYDDNPVLMLIRYK